MGTANECLVAVSLETIYYRAIGDQKRQVLGV